MPQGYPWGMPENFAPGGFNPGPQDAPVVPNVITPAPPVVHTVPAAPPSVNLVPFVNEDVCRPFPRRVKTCVFMTEWMISKSSLIECKER